MDWDLGVILLFLSVVGPLKCTHNGTTVKREAQM